ncbi:Peptidyl-prolyl cis-trans isomerase pin4 [Coemansia spiralis]|uniref:Peptidyl-prolyl cis-trans isomerase pin4 n=1 Tax=Coemansia spiralis TaxID=417178 RepID=A0A9W8GDK0_9FUNG|nr:Peptidyl-prolyl cis-trans isomerase pin4 [Coemansia spiralis]
MSKAIQETLRKLEQTSIGESSTGASSPSATSTASAASPLQKDELSANSTKDVSGISAIDAMPTAAAAAAPTSDQQFGADGNTFNRNRARRAVQSMYGAPPGYTASMGVGGGRDSLGRGRVASNRQRNSIMVPDQLQAAMHPQSIVPMAPLQTPVTRLTGAEYALMANMPDDAIPNAIVVKNINFAIKREELLQTMADLGLPLPYAFNYHFDSGVFRGLAFGNFRTPEEAARVIVGLNGLTLLGRPLKVEYKKALPGTAPPPHPNTIAMMNSASGAQPGMDVQGDNGFGASLSTGLTQNQHQQQPLQQQPQQQQQQQFDRPIPRTRRTQNGEGAERPRSMMVLSTSSMSIPDSLSGHSSQQQHQVQQQQQQINPKGSSANDDSSSMIDLDDEATRTLYDVVSHFRHDKNIAELEFPCTLNTKQRQTIMLISERFGLNHETKSDSNGRYIRVYKGLDTLLEATEVRRRSVASPGSNSMSGNGNMGGQTMRYGTQGRSRPSSMLYPDSMSMSGMASPPPQRMNSYQPAQQQQGYQNESSRVRSYTHSQGAMSHFSGMQYQQQQQQQQQYQQQSFPRANDNSGRASGNYVGYPTRLYQDSAVVPTRQPRGPEMSQNFVSRQQMHVQEERHAQRQMQLKVLQQIRQRRLSSAGDDGSAPPTPSLASMPSPVAGSSATSAFKIEKPASKAIPIVKPKDNQNTAEDNDTAISSASRQSQEQNNKQDKNEQINNNKDN